MLQSEAPAGRTLLIFLIFLVGGGNTPEAVRLQVWFDLF